MVHEKHEMGSAGISPVRQKLGKRFHGGPDQVEPGQDNDAIWADPHKNANPKVGVNPHLRRFLFLILPLATAMPTSQQLDIHHVLLAQWLGCVGMCKAERFFNALKRPE